MAAQIEFNAQTLPEGVCFSSEQQRFNAFVAYLSGFLPGDYTAFNIGTNQPSVDDQDKPWLRTNADGTFDRLYTFSGGAWTSPHPVPSTSKRIWLYYGTPTDLETEDGGSSGAVTTMTGPFFEIVTDFTDKIPRGVGVVALNTDAAQLSSGASSSDEVRGVYFIRRTAREYYTV